MSRCADLLTPEQRATLAVLPFYPDAKTLAHQMQITEVQLRRRLTHIYNALKLRTALQCAVLYDREKRVVKMSKPDWRDNPWGLTRMECATAYALPSHPSAKAVALHLDLSRHTVVQYLRQCHSKMQLHTNLQVALEYDRWAFAL